MLILSYFYYHSTILLLPFNHCTIPTIMKLFTKPYIRMNGVALFEEARHNGKRAVHLPAPQIGQVIQRRLALNRYRLSH